MQRLERSNRVAEKNVSQLHVFFLKWMPALGAGVGRSVDVIVMLCPLTLCCRRRRTGRVKPLLGHPMTSFFSVTELDIFCIKAESPMI